MRRTESPRMPALTIDDRARFVSVLSFDLAAGDVFETSRELQRTVERRGPNSSGLIGCVVMVNKEEARLSVVSLWESAHAWGAAQYDKEIGEAFADAVETAKSYDIRTYETVTVVRT